MKAVFTGNPYGFWKYTCNAELHLFDSSKQAEAFAALNDDYIMCDSPNDFECAKTFGMLVYDYASCCGWENVVLHLSNQDFFDNAEMLDWGFDIIARYDYTSCNWTWNDGRIIRIDLYIEPEIGAESRSFHEEGDKLCALLHDVYDVEPFEVYEMTENGSEYAGYSVHDFEEMREEQLV